MISKPETPCRLILDAAAAGTWQMAVDEVLLLSAAERSRASLRFYGWTEPTLSLGYFQSFRAADQHLASRTCPRVRRLTGGGAILHDDELTYSLALPVAHPLAADATHLYNAAHEALCGVLEAFGIVSQLRPQDFGESPFLCFQRCTRGDVLLGHAKICGSAQRRRRGAILQHGSLLLAQSPNAPELPGLKELADVRIDHPRLIAAWSDGIAGRVGLKLTPGRLDAVELDGVRRLAIEKYGTAHWNERR